MTGLPEHPQRRQLAAEIHARPSEPVESPQRMSHLAFLSGETALKAERAALLEFFGHYGVPAPALTATMFRADLGPFRLRWERHTEFSTYVFSRRGGEDGPFAHPVIADVPPELLQMIPGDLMVATHLAFERRRGAERERSAADWPYVVRTFGHDAILGSTVAGGTADAFGDFVIGSDGFTRFLVLDRGMTSQQAGRLARRVLEIETYRVMALLGLPLARDAGPRVTQLDRRLADIIRTMSTAAGGNPQEDESQLSALTELAAEVEGMAAQTNFRFGAARAYHAVMTRRLAELREQRIEGLPPFDEFMERRIGPAVATCLSVESRIESLSVRVSRASQLLRTRVDITLERQNTDLLKSMDARARLQLRLQQTVEGLSIVAITYYTVALVGSGAKAAQALGVAIDPDVAIGVAIPVVLAIAAAGVRSLRRTLSDPQ